MNLLKEIYFTWKCKWGKGHLSFWEFFIWRIYHKFVNKKLKSKIYGE